MFWVGTGRGRRTSSTLRASRVRMWKAKRASFGMEDVRVDLDVCVREMEGK